MSALTQRIMLVVALCAPAIGAEILNVAAIGVTVRSLEQSVAFYRDVLRFEVVGVEEREGEAFERVTGVFAAHARTAVLRLGEERLELTEYLAPEGRSVPEAWRACDQWFQHVAIVVRDMDEAYSALRAANVRHASPSPQTLPEGNPDAGGIRAFYFKDPDGHALEIIWFPEGKGDARWRVPTDRLFLGIDHTAIVVRDTQRSLEYYRDTLGLRVVGASRNHGVEQERLNAVFGASLRITALRAAHGPGVELLEYIAPIDCAAYPPDTGSNDLIHWQIIAQADSVEEVATKARAAGGRLVSRGVATSGWKELPAALVRDPDGHALLAWQTIPPGVTGSSAGDIVR